MEDQLPITFRASEVEQIMAVLRAGESCTVVGIGSVGKSNLLRFLQREDVRQAYLGDEWAAYLFVANEHEFGTILFGSLPAWYLEIIIPIGFFLVGCRFGLRIITLVFPVSTGEAS